MVVASGWLIYLKLTTWEPQPPGTLKACSGGYLTLLCFTW